MKAKLMRRIRKKMAGLYCSCIVVDREKLLTDAGMFVYINMCCEFSMRFKDGGFIIHQSYYSRPTSCTYLYYYSIKIINR